MPKNDADSPKPDRLWRELVLLRHPLTDAGFVLGTDGFIYAEHESGVRSKMQHDQQRFDVKAYGAVGDGVTDDTVAIQAAIDDAAAHNGTNIGRVSGVVFLPPGKYKITSPLLVIGEFTVGSQWNYCSVTIEGDAKSYGNGWNATSIEPTFTDGPALVIQGARDVTLRNLTFIGKNTFMASQLAIWPNNVDGHWSTEATAYLLAGMRSNRYSPYCAVVVDPFHANITGGDQYPTLTEYYTNTGGGGSSQVHLENVSVYYFTAAIVVTPQLPAPDGLQNGENFTFRNVFISDCKDGLCIGQEQSRGLHWYGGLIGNCRVCVNCADYGAGRGQPPNFYGVMMGSSKWAFKVTPTWTAPVEVSGIYSENLISIGFPAAMHFSGCRFGFPATPAGKPSIPRLVPMGAVSFNGCTFFTATGEPQWHVPTLYTRVGFSDCSFATPSPQQDSAPRHWFCGLRHLADYDRCEDWAKPNKAFFGPRWQVDFLSNLFNYALQPGTIFSAGAGTEAMRVLDTQWPSASGGSPSVTIYADGHATIPGANLDQIYAVGDIVETTTTYDASVWESQSVSPITNTTVLGKVSAVTPTEVTVSHVPFYMCPASGSAAANHTLTIRWLPRVHEPTTGQINFSGDMTQVINVSPVPSSNSRWIVGDRIRDKQGRITAGTYVSAVSGTTITLSKAAAGGAGTETLDLYGATVYTLGRTQIP